MSDAKLEKSEDEKLGGTDFHSTEEGRNVAGAGHKSCAGMQTTEFESSWWDHTSASVWDKEMLTEWIPGDKA